MMNVCFRCGVYRADKIIDPAGPFAICPECGHAHPFRQLPLLVVGGASGSGKSAVLQRLTGRLEGVIPLEADIIWRAEFNQPETSYRDFFETWLRIGKNISQAGTPVMLFGAGLGVPGNLEPCVERRYFSRIHYLALVCDEDALRVRLSSRPAWRGCQSEEYQRSHAAFNDWLKAYDGEPRIERIDTTRADVDATAAAVADWARAVTAA